LRAKLKEFEQCLRLILNFKSASLIFSFQNKGIREFIDSSQA
jgi:hypothetical protein